MPKSKVSSCNASNLTRVYIYLHGMAVQGSRFHAPAFGDLAARRNQHFRVASIEEIDLQLRYACLPVPGTPGQQSKLPDLNNTCKPLHYSMERTNPSSQTQKGSLICWTSKLGEKERNEKGLTKTRQCCVSQEQNRTRIPDCDVWYFKVKKSSTYIPLLTKKPEILFFFKKKKIREHVK